MLTWKDLAVAEARCKARRHRAMQNERLSAHFPQPLYPHSPHARAFACFGVQLIRLGSYLQARYANRPVSLAEPMEQLPGPTRS
jgi:hypothetical protein